jgi:hypothetical protein
MRMKGAGCLRLCCGEACVEVRTPEARLCAALAHLFAPFVTSHDAPSGSTGHTLTATVDDDEYTASSLGTAVFEVEHAIAEKLFHRSDRLLLHSGAVADDGRTVFILGPSGSGKTTTTLELVRRGYRFLADEYTALDATGTILYPIPRGLVIKESVLPLPPGDSLEVAGDWGRRTLYLPSNRADLTPHSIAKPWLIFPRYRRGSPASARSLPTGELCMHLLHATFRFETHESTLWPALSSLAVQANGCSLDYEDIERDLDVALRCLEGG